jgi:hypothetical protein
MDSANGVSRGQFGASKNKRNNTAERAEQAES